MKKKYVKPTIFIENFEISEQIAAACFKKVSKPNFVLQPNGDTCTVEVPDEIMPGIINKGFNRDSLNCKTDLSPQYCYNNSADTGFMIFGS